MERRALRRAVAFVVLTAVAAGGGWWYLRGRGGASAGRVPGPTPGAPSAALDRLVPEGTRIRVEVVNATDVRGLARRGSFYLRDLGFDVVDFRTTSEKRDSTLVIDRSGHPEWAALAAKALGGARVESRPDSSRYLDLTVLLGATWRPPAQPLYP